MHPELLELARAQGAALTRAQVFRHHDHRTLSDWLTAGIVQRTAPGVFALDPVPDDVGSRFRRAQLALGVPLIVCGPTAAALHGFPESLTHHSSLHVTTMPGRSLRSPRGVRVHQQVPRSTAVLVAGVPVVPFADAALDLAMAARSLDRLAILDVARALDPSLDLVAAIERAKGRRGLDEVRRLAPHASALAESLMESRVRQRIVQAGLPDPEVQVLVPLDDGLRRVDLAYRDRLIGIEYDGEEFHTGDGALRRDRRRHLALTEAGWIMIYLTADDVYVRPERFLRTLSDLLRRGQPV